VSLRLLPLAAALGGLAFTPATAHAPAAPQSTARCDIGNSDGANYQGPCIFVLGPKGSFSVVRYGNARIIDDVIELQVDIQRPGVAEVQGLTALGTRLRWGRANRSKACWRGTSFWICVYGA
jgi:hypothetical protein